MTLFGVLERVLVGSASDAQRLGANGWAGGLECGHGWLLLAAMAALTSTGELGVELLFATEQAVARDTHIVEHNL